MWEAGPLFTAGVSKSLSFWEVCCLLLDLGIHGRSLSSGPQRLLLFQPGEKALTGTLWGQNEEMALSFEERETHSAALHQGDFIVGTWP
jgi:hypothetical protein